MELNSIKVDEDALEIVLQRFGKHPCKDFTNLDLVTMIELYEQAKSIK